MKVICLFVVFIYLLGNCNGGRRCGWPIACQCVGMGIINCDNLGLKNLPNFRVKEKRFVRNLYASNNDISVVEQSYIGTFPRLEKLVLFENPHLNCSNFHLMKIEILYSGCSTVTPNPKKTTRKLDQTTQHHMAVTSTILWATTGEYETRNTTRYNQKCSTGMWREVLLGISGFINIAFITIISIVLIRWKCFAGRQNGAGVGNIVLNPAAIYETDL